MKYLIRFWFDFGGFCLWGIDEKTKNKFGYAIDVNELNLSEAVKSDIYKLQEEYSTYLDLTDPLAPSAWSKEQKENFLNRSRRVFNEMQQELGSDYKMVFEVEKNIHD